MIQNRKLARLEDILRSYGSCLIAFSGGVDSTFLLKVASTVLPAERLLAVTAASKTYPREELDFSRRITREWRIPFKVIRTREFEDRRFVANTPQRCFYCKSELFERLAAVAVRAGLDTLVDASTVSDRSDYRPGNAALRKYKVRSPLIEAGFTKEDVRFFSRQMRLVTWNKPSLACLASRIPYGTPVTAQVVKRIHKAEQSVRKIVPGQVRVRDYGATCRIEVSDRFLSRVVRHRRELVNVLHKAGYTYITIDLEGYRSGSLNALLRKKKR